DDAGIKQELFKFCVGKPCDLCGLEIGKRPAIVVAFCEYSIPAQSGLSAFKDQELKKYAVIVLRHAPLRIVIVNGESILRPRTTLHKFRANEIFNKCSLTRASSCRPEIPARPSPF